MNRTPHSRPFEPGRSADVPPDAMPSPVADAEASSDIFGDMRQLDSELAQEQSNRNTLISMLSGARSLTPMLEACVYFPGLHAPPEDLQHSVETMMAATRSITDHAMQTLGIEDTPDRQWAKSMLMGLAVGGVAEQWKHQGTVTPENWLSLIDSLVAAGVTETTREYPDVADQTAYTVSHFAALSELAGEVRRFSFFFDQTALLERLSGYLDAEVEKSVAHVLEGVDTTDADRLMVEQGLLKHASRLFTEIYREHAQETYLSLSRMNEAERRDFMEAGRPRACVEHIRTSFQSLFSTLTQTSRARAQACVARQSHAGPNLS